MTPKLGMERTSSSLLITRMRIVPRTGAGYSFDGNRVVWKPGDMYTVIMSNSNPETVESPQAKPKVTPLNRTLFGDVFVNITDAYAIKELVFASSDEIRRVALQLLEEADSFDASGA